MFKDQGEELSCNTLGGKVFLSEKHLYDIFKVSTKPSPTTARAWPVCQVGVTAQWPATYTLVAIDSCYINLVSSKRTNFRLYTWCNTH
jgi:hypothetical protein